MSVETTAKWYVEDAVRPLNIIEWEVTSEALDVASP